jgi:DNA polymerase III subunit gamma/tau
VFNALQEREYRHIQNDLIAYIRKELKNSSLQMSVRLVEEVESNRSISPEDRYKQMVENNPAIEILRSGLQMEID